MAADAGNPVAAKARSPQRRVLRISLLLSLGLLLNVGIAWWCVGTAGWRGRWSAPAFDPNAPMRWLWPSHPDPGPPNSRWDSRSFGGHLVEVASMVPLSEVDDERLMAGATQRSYRAGWPLLALQTRDQYPPRHAWNPRFLTPDIWINSWEQGLGITGNIRHGQITLPLLPRWPGFAVNTLLYATVAWLLAATIATGRRSLRARRGRCRQCGYLLNGFAQCPECGAHVAPPHPPAHARRTG
jgi:hypothetical protein